MLYLCKSQIIIAEHECSTNWGDCKSNKSNQMLVFEERGNRSTRRKTSERSHHCANPAPLPTLLPSQPCSPIVSALSERQAITSDPTILAFVMGVKIEFTPGVRPGQDNGRFHTRGWTNRLDGQIVLDEQIV